MSGLSVSASSMGSKGVLVLVSMLLILTVAAGKVEKRPKVLVYYEIEDLVPQEISYVITSSPSGNKSSVEFGTVAVFSNVVRESVERGSRVLGKSQGIATALNDNHIFVVYDLVYDTPELNGTIGFQGRLDDSGNGEVQVVGGTGSFRLARGYAKVSLVSQDDLSDVIYKNVIHLTY